MSNGVFRKSWVAYLGPVVGVFIASAVILFLVENVAEIRSITRIRGFTGFNLESFIFLSPFLFVSLILLLIVWKIAVLRSARLSINDQSLDFVYGILPWATEERSWARHHIFSAEYRYEQKFMGWLFRIGTIIIVGREGSTHKYEIKGMHRPRRAASEITGFAGRS